MASYSYAGLEVRVTADTRGMANDIRQGATSAGEDAAKSIGQRMTAGLKGLGGIGAAVGTSVATGLGLASTAAIGFGVASFKAAARASEMDATLVALARANKLNVDSLRDVVAGVKSQGIELGVAQGLTAQFVRSQLDLSKATDLARVAQDAAVISGRNSTEVLDDLVHGITTQNTMVLRNAGIQVNATKAQDAFAKSLGKTRAELTEAEKAQATLNAVLSEGEKVAGAYEVAMKEPGKVLRSFKRVVDDIKISVGEGLVRAFGPVILQAYDLVKAFAGLVDQTGALWPLLDEVVAAVMRLTKPLADLLARFVDLAKNIRPEQYEAITEIFAKFGPAILIAAGALAAFTGGGVLTQIPILGGLFKNLLGPILKLGPALLALPPPVLAVGAAIGLLLAVSPKLRGAVVDIAKAFISALRPAFDAVAGAIKQAIPPIMSLLKALGDGLGPLLKELVPLLAPLGSIIGTVLATAFKQLGQAAGALAPIVTVVLQVLTFLLRMVVAVVAPILSVASGMLKAGAAAGTVVHPLQILVSIFRAVSEAIQTVVRWIFGGSPGLIPAFVALAGVVGGVRGALSAITGAFKAMAAGIAAAWSAVTGATRAAVSAIGSAMSAASSAVSSAFASIRSAAASGASAVLSAVSSAFGQLRGVVSSAMAAIPGLVSSGLSAAVGAARSGGAAIMSGLQSGIQSAAGAVMSTISSVAGKVAGALSSALKIGSPSKLTIPMGRDLFAGLIVGFDRAADHAEFGAPNLHGAPGASPLGGHPGALGGLGGAGAVINVYPSAGMDERALAAAVSRELAWAAAGGVR